MIDGVTYQNPPTDRDIVADTLNSLQDEIDDINNTKIPALEAKDKSLDTKTDLTNRKLTAVIDALGQINDTIANMGNVVFIGDSYGTGWYKGSSESATENWQAYLAGLLKLNNYRRYAKGGLCFTKASPNNLKAYIDDVIYPGETATGQNPNTVTSIIMMIGVNDSILSFATNNTIRSDSNETITYLQSKFPNAQIYCFYNSTSYLKYCTAVGSISEGLLKTKAIFIAESCQWMINDTNMIENHPNAIAAMQIAQNMFKYFKGDSNYSKRSTWIQFTPKDSTFTMTGGIVITVENMRVNFFTAGTRTDTQQRYAVVVCEGGAAFPETYRPGESITIPFFDITNYVAGSIVIFKDGVVMQICDRNTLSTVSTPNTYLSIPISIYKGA